MKKYLLVIDMQNDFIHMALGTAEAVAIVPKVKQKIAQYLQAGDNVIFTRDTHQQDYLSTNEGKYLPVPHCIEGSIGWQIYDGLANEHSVVVDKPTFGYLGWKNLIEEDKDLQIELVGLCTDICVASNALILKALFPNATVKVDSSACAGVTPQTHLSALETMKMCQVEVI